MTPIRQKLIEIKERAGARHAPYKSDNISGGMDFIRGHDSRNAEFEALSKALEIAAAALDIIHYGDEMEYPIGEDTYRKATIEDAAREAEIAQAEILKVLNFEGEEK